MIVEFLEMVRNSLCSSEMIVVVTDSLLEIFVRLYNWGDRDLSPSR